MNRVVATSGMASVLLCCSVAAYAAHAGVERECILAARAMSVSNYFTAWQIYSGLAVSSNASFEEATNSFGQATCAWNWRWQTKEDRVLWERIWPREHNRFLDRFAEHHSDNWQALMLVSRAYRGQHSLGELVDTEKASLVYALRAEPMAEEAACASDFLGYCLEVSSMLMGTQCSTNNDFWDIGVEGLDILTDITTLPTNKVRQRYRGKADKGGQRCYLLPTKFSLAVNDGERLRWLLAQVVRLAPTTERLVTLALANLFAETIDVHRLPYVSAFDPRYRERVEFLRSLKNNESAAMSKEGVVRTPLRDEVNYMHMLQRIGEGTDDLANCARVRLAYIYRNRFQIEKMCEVLGKGAFVPGLSERATGEEIADDDERNDLLKQRSVLEQEVDIKVMRLQMIRRELVCLESYIQSDVVGVVFRPEEVLLGIGDAMFPGQSARMTNSAGWLGVPKSCSVGDTTVARYLSQGVRSVRLELARVDVVRLVCEMTTDELWAFRKGWGPWADLLGYVENDDFPSASSGSMPSPFDPRPYTVWETNWMETVDAFVPQVPVGTVFRVPSVDAGAYCLTAVSDSGVTNRAFFLIVNSVLAVRDTKEGLEILVVDSTNGERVADAQVTVRELGQVYDVAPDSTSAVSRTSSWSASIASNHITRVAVRTDSNGRAMVSGVRADRSDVPLLFTVMRADGETTRLLRGGSRYGPVSVGYAFVTADRPVSRPGETVRFKVWTQMSSETPRNGPITVRVVIDRGGDVNNPFSPARDNAQRAFVAEYELDEWGCCSGEWAIPAEAHLGAYWFDVELLGGGSVTNSAGSGARSEVPNRDGVLDPFGDPLIAERRLSFNMRQQGFRVEAFRPTEFRVTMSRPSTVVRVGNKVRLGVDCRYWSGDPVAGGNARYNVKTVFRRPRSIVVEEPWMERFLESGVQLPRWEESSGWGVPWPESVEESGCVVLSDDGSAEIEVDTAKLPSSAMPWDQWLKVDVEVTDMSGRYGKCEMNMDVPVSSLHAEVTLDRLFVRTNEQVVLDIAARIGHGLPAAGAVGAVSVSRIAVTKDGCVERLIQRTGFSVDARGNARVSVRPTQGGLYRCRAVTEVGDESVTNQLSFFVQGGVEDEVDTPFPEFLLMTDRRSYGSGEVVRVLVADRRTNYYAVVLVDDGGLQANGILTLRTQGHSAIGEYKIGHTGGAKVDVSCVIVADGQAVHRECSATIEGRQLLVDVVPSKDMMAPGESAMLTVKVRDRSGKPCSACSTVTGFDSASSEESEGFLSLSSAGGLFDDERHPRSPSYMLPYCNSSDPFESFNQEGLAHVQSLLSKVSAVTRSEATEVEALRKKVKKLDLKTNIVLLKQEIDELDSRRLKSQRMIYQLRCQFEMLRGCRSAEDGSPEEGGVPADHGRTASKDGATAAPARLRRDFRTSLVWAPTVLTDSNGVATVPFTMPDSLTQWKLCAWSVDRDKRSGGGDVSLVSRKNLYIRPLLPRFLVEGDEARFEFMVHNGLQVDKEVTASMIVSSQVVRVKGSATRRMTVAAGSSARVGWMVQATAAGPSLLRMAALTDEESDVVEQKFPVLDRGAEVGQVWSTWLESGSDEKSFEFEIPQGKPVTSAVLKCSVSPLMVEPLLDALPYVVGYPYGCVEQTMSRFLPTLQTQNLLKRMGVDPATVLVANPSSNPYATEDGAGQLRRSLSDSELSKMVEKGIRRLETLRNASGGWSWLGGGDGDLFMTSYVLHGLQVAASSGYASAARLLNAEREPFLASVDRRFAEVSARDDPGMIREDSQYRDRDAFALMVASSVGSVSITSLDRCMEGRKNLSFGGLSCLAWALHSAGYTNLEAEVFDDLQSMVVYDEGSKMLALVGDGTVTPDGSTWSDAEAWALYLGLLCRTRKGGDRTPRLALQIIGDRARHTAWRSTRETSMCVGSLADYLGAREMWGATGNIEFLLDGVKQGMLQMQTNKTLGVSLDIEMRGSVLGAGRHRLAVRRNGQGVPSVNAVLTYLSDDAQESKGVYDIAVSRRYFKIQGGRQRESDDGTPSNLVRSLVGPDTVLKRGELVEVELTLSTSADLRYILVEDMKPAGFEPLEIESGRHYGDVWGIRELREDRVAFLLPLLHRGSRAVTYRVRVETLGSVCARPATIQAMYAPQCRGNSSTMRLRIEE